MYLKKQAHDSRNASGKALFLVDVPEQFKDCREIKTP